MDIATASRLRLVTAAILFSTGGAAIKACSLDGFQVACFRSGVAALALAVMMPSAWRHWTGRTLLVGSSYAATMVLFVQANKLTTAASTIFLQSTAPLYLLLLGPWLLREPVRRRDLAFMGALAFGLALFFLDGSTPAPTAPSPLRGNVAGALAGLTWALTLIGLRWTARRRHNPRRASAGAAVLAGNCLACLATLPAAVPLQGVSPRDIGLVSYLGIVQIALAYVFLTKGIRHVGALAASLLLLAEPALNPLWAWIINAEAPGTLPLAGGAIILSATTLHTWMNERHRLGRVP